MNQTFDDFSKALAAPLPRRESLRRLGAVFAGAVLAPFGLETSGHAAGDPCLDFCKCANSKQRNQCLQACRACKGNTSRLCGTCGAYACCKTDRPCCSGRCTNVAADFDNCGACGHACPDPGPYEYGACIGGQCVYDCVEGATDCNGTCTFLGNDPDNCGACGVQCAEGEACINGFCEGAGTCPSGLTWCGSECVDLSSDTAHCGACGSQCGEGESCVSGFCQGGYCVGYGVAICGGQCVFINSDNNNCGGCGVQCTNPGDQCTGGRCVGSCSGCQ